MERPGGGTQNLAAVSGKFHCLATRVRFRWVHGLEASLAARRSLHCTDAGTAQTPRGPGTFRAPYLCDERRDAVLQAVSAGVLSRTGAAAGVDAPWLQADAGRVRRRHAHEPVRRPLWYHRRLSGAGVTWRHRALLAVVS